MILPGSADHVKGLDSMLLIEEAVDGGLQVRNRAEDATLQPTLFERGEEPFGSVDPRARCRREVESEARMPVEPSHDLGMLVRRVIVEDHVDDLSSREI